MTRGVVAPPGAGFTSWLEAALELLGAAGDPNLKVFVTPAAAEELGHLPPGVEVMGLEDDEDLVLVYSPSAAVKGAGGLIALYHPPVLLTDEEAETYQRLRLDGVPLERALELVELLQGT